MKNEMMNEKITPAITNNQFSEPESFENIVKKMASAIAVKKAVRKANLYDFLNRMAIAFI